jgi:hypothetical protein
MILYKYVSFATARRIVEINAIAFSKPKHFNDPFDMPTYPEEPASDRAPLSDVFADLRTMFKNHIWAENTGVLSLTRTPANALMWAHYADSHKGVVIGIDVEIAGFAAEASNLIPAQYGSVIYVSQRDTGQFFATPTRGITVGQTHDFRSDHYEKLQRIFLHKPLYWSYEEEVRVLKSLHGVTGEQAQTPSGNFRIEKTPERDVYLYILPKNSIREIYIGFRSDQHSSDALVDRTKKVNSRISAFECALDTSRFTISFSKYSYIDEGNT